MFNGTFSFDFMKTVWNTHKIDCIMISISLLLTITATFFFFAQPSVPIVEASSIKEVSTSTIKEDIETNSIAVDVSGAILKPGVYEVTTGARLADIIAVSGGLTYDADKYFVARNFNMAKFLHDQEKIYIPYTWDIYNGTFSEERRILEYLEPNYNNSDPVTDTNSPSDPTKLSINTASTDELDLLPGVGPTTVQKIIQNRPFSAIDELISKKLIKQSVYDEILPLIQL